MITYTITDADTAGPFAESIPEDYREKAKMKNLSFISAHELLAEKFHMSEELLKKLNPDATFDTAGTEIMVANARKVELRGVTRIGVDATEQVVRAYGSNDQTLAVYPATVGSTERPSPEGEFKVTAVVENPTYYYDPKNNISGVEVEENLKMPPGPNNPVGSTWIDLSSKGYGIHGTPEPDRVSKSTSHGCIRLTNWDARELGKSVKKGTPVAIKGKTASYQNASGRR